MKRKLATILIASSLFFNPTFKNSNFKEKEFFKKVQKIRESLEEMSNLTYIREEGDYWKNPSETLKDKGGDCEDFAILLKEKLDKKGINSKLIAGKLEKTSKNYHGWLGWNTEFGDYIIDPVNKFFEKKENILKVHPNLFYKESQKIYGIQLRINEYEYRNGIKLDFKGYE